jgi:phospholipase D3/4
MKSAIFRIVFSLFCKNTEMISNLIAVAKNGSVRMRIAQNLQEPNLDTIDLSKFESVQVKSLNFSALMGAGILHTKLWLVDRSTIEKFFWI